MASKSDKQIVFIVDCQNLDIDCAILVDEPAASVRLVKTKHRKRVFEVPAILCHNTLEEAKKAVLKYVRLCAQHIEEMEYDAENFLVS